MRRQRPMSTMSRASLQPTPRLHQPQHRLNTNEAICHDSLLLDCPGLYRGCRPVKIWRRAELQRLVELVSNW